MKTGIKTTMLVAVGFILVACGPSRPGWVDGVAPFADAGVQALYATGTARIGPSVAATRTKAEARARTEIAKQVETYAESFIKDFMEQSNDFMDSDKESSVEFFSQVAKNVSKATLKGAMVIDTWQDDDNWYSLIKMPLNAQFIQAYQQQVNEVLQQNTAVDLGSKADNMLQELERELTTKTSAQGM